MAFADEVVDVLNTWRENYNLRNDPNATWESKLAADVNMFGGLIGLGASLVSQGLTPDTIAAEMTGALSATAGIVGLGAGIVGSWLAVSEAQAKYTNYPNEANGLALLNAYIKWGVQLSGALAAAGLAFVVGSELLPIIAAAGLAYGLSGLIYDIIRDLPFALPDLYTNVVSPLLAILHDPLVIDLDGDGIELTKLGTIDHGSQTFFDYNGDGFAERTEWVKPDDGILVHDKNGNGIVDNASELFGSVSVDGFEVLELLDTNADRKIDASDAKFAELRIWRDLNGNAKRQAANSNISTLALAA